MHMQQQPLSMQSTPPLAQQHFVNDQQRNIVTNAQQASQSFTLPQNTQQSNDIMNEDTATIQDALEALNNDSSAKGQPVNTNYQIQPSQQEIDDYIACMQSAQPPPIAYNPDISTIMMNTHQQIPNSIGEVDMKSKLINDILSWNDELKVALFGTAIFVLVYAFPIEKYIYKYISLDKIPNSNMVIKAIIMFVSILIISKLCK